MTDFHVGDDLPGHPSSEELAAYLNGSLGVTDRGSVEAHLLSCRECRREFASTRRLLRRHWTRRNVLAIAPIAVAAVLAFVVISRNWPGDAGDGEQLRGPGATGSDTVASILAVEPRNDVTVDARDMTFVWRGTGGRPLYRLSLTDGSGKAVWSVETMDTTVALPPSISLEPGRRYFWTVDALSADGRSLTTGARRFTKAR